MQPMMCNTTGYGNSGRLHLGAGHKALDVAVACKQNQVEFHRHCESPKT